MAGWKLISSGVLEGLKNIIPLELADEDYVMALSARNNSLLTIVKNGSD